MPCKTRLWLRDQPHLERFSPAKPAGLFICKAAAAIPFRALSLPRHDHPLQPRLQRIISARAIVEDGNAESAAPIAAFATQTELQIEDERYPTATGKSALMEQLRYSQPDGKPGVAARHGRCRELAGLVTLADSPPGARPSYLQLLSCQAQASRSMLPSSSCPGTRICPQRWSNEVCNFHHPRSGGGSLRHRRRPCIGTSRTRTAHRWRCGRCNRPRLFHQSLIVACTTHLATTSTFFVSKVALSTMRISLPTKA